MPPLCFRHSFPLIFIGVIIPVILLFVIGIRKGKDGGDMRLEKSRDAAAVPRKSVAGFSNLS
jgi:hypothetical protein